MKRPFFKQLYLEKWVLVIFVLMSKKNINGNLNNERYYDNDGKAYRDKGYINHGNYKTHPKVLHEYKITFIGSKMYRE